MYKLKQWFRGKVYDFLMWVLNEHMCQLDRKVESTRKSIDELYRTIQMLDLAKVGTDHHISDKSWAVVCTRDKHGQERVNFYTLRDEDVHGLNGMLCAFKRDNVIVDAHPLIKPFFIW